VAADGATGATPENPPRAPAGLPNTIAQVFAQKGCRANAADLTFRHFPRKCQTRSFASCRALDPVRVMATFSLQDESRRLGFPGVEAARISWLLWDCAARGGEFCTHRPRRHDHGLTARRRQRRQPAAVPPTDRQTQRQVWSVSSSASRRSWRSGRGARRLQGPGHGAPEPGRDSPGRRGPRERPAGCRAAQSPAPSVSRARDRDLRRDPRHARARAVGAAATARGRGRGHAARRALPRGGARRRGGPRRRRLRGAL